jgi:hypothetical protein
VVVGLRPSSMESFANSALRSATLVILPPYLR